MPRLFYPADWENLAVFFARAKRTSKLPAADLAQRLGDDGGRFELQSLAHAGSARVDKIEVCDCGGLWIITWVGWYQACDFEIRYRLPAHQLSGALILPLVEDMRIEQLAKEAGIELSDNLVQRIKWLAAIMNPDGRPDPEDILKKADYQAECMKTAPKITKREYQDIAWPWAREIAGLPPDRRGPKPAQRK